MGVGQGETAGDAREPRRRLEKAPPHRRQIDGAAEKTTPERIIYTVPRQRIDQAGDVGRAMLSVGVKGDDNVGALVQSKFNSGLQRRTLSEIYRMPDHDSARAFSDLRGGVGRTVVDEHG